VHCGGVIGVYEPVFVDLGRPRRMRTSLLALTTEERALTRAFWHEDCVDCAPPGEPGSSA